ncbi:MAG: tRNA uridine(34) 5-carboxymethylaminomethyl modification radical SAM/GNAT enzyme Elp3, partial [Anaerolineae bacterium]|nr:tRNA uridine(34) 5-carboxymethylaminomethyl modification radical SAM/GNAT enzyme Elp3 [Anaerolineae bacterium]
MTEDTRSERSLQRGPTAWQPRGRDFDARQHQDALLAIFAAVREATEWDQDTLMRILARYGRDGKGTTAGTGGGYFSKIELVTGYRQLTAAGVLPFERHVLRRLQMKPVRTSSGVTPVTVLTEPAGCPGRCIFCPDAEGMPKSYLPDEPGARRAAQCGFDPYLQVRTRLETFQAMGHSADKVELLILGGTWSAYPRRYREWFVTRCLDALNAEPDEAAAQPSVDGPAQPSDRSSFRPSFLLQAQARNETAPHRNVGLVIETRPDWVTADEIVHLRRLGVTKVQLGVQSLDDRIRALKQRGHDVATVRRAVGLLRAAGFKLHLHWMPNLYGATPASDRADFARLWSDPALRPDELKIYPCSIIAGTELYRLWQEGSYRPYTDEELIALVADCKATIPPYCRVNRVFRDIPADDIVAGVKSSNLRQLVHAHMAERGQVCRCIRCREVRGSAVGEDELHLVVHAYETAGSQEQFLSYETAGGRLAGFLRLSLPARDDPSPWHTEIWEAIPEIARAAMIREVHVYGPALEIGAESAGEAQHLGLGRRLIAEARARAAAAGFERLAVISAIGTRRYYERLGFARGELYM